MVQILQNYFCTYVAYNLKKKVFTVIFFNSRKFAEYVN